MNFLVLFLCHSFLVYVLVLSLVSEYAKLHIFKRHFVFPQIFSSPVSFYVSFCNLFFLT